ncbi:hypothetical protein ACJ41O_007607 [Fusarium nematophilum]
MHLNTGLQAAIAILFCRMAVANPIIAPRSPSLVELAPFQMTAADSFSNSAIDFDTWAQRMVDEGKMWYPEKRSFSVPATKLKTDVVRHEDGGLSLRQNSEEVGRFIIHGWPVDSFLDSPSPLEEHELYNEPTKLCQTKWNTAFLTNVCDSPSVDAFYRKFPLKAMSLVSRSWRKTVLPTLFRHVIWATQLIERPEGDDDPLSVLPFLGFLLPNGLASNVQSATILLSYPATEGWAEEHRQTMGIQADSDAHDLPRKEDLWDNNWLWNTIFQHLNPLRFTLISSPALLLVLLGRSITLPKKFVMPAYHIISLSRAPSTATLPNPLRPEDVKHSLFMPCTLFTIRPWDSLLLNEGSSLDI